MEDEDDDDNGTGDPESLADLGAQILKALDSESVAVKLQNGKTVTGTMVGFSIKRKSRKGNVSWNGRLNVETESGVLAMDCANIASIAGR